MKTKLLIILASINLMLLPINAAAFECAEHIQAAKDLINKVKEDMKGMANNMPKEHMVKAHMLLDDAKMFLHGAEHNHNKPQGPVDHARSIAKADAAKGYALAADILHFEMMKSNMMKSKMMKSKMMKSKMMKHDK